MLKLVKYEYRRNVTGIVVMLVGILGLEAYFLLAAMNKSYENVITSAVLLAMVSMVAVLGIMVYSISLYSRELGAKTSYLTFMTPNSSAKILGAKLLATLILGAIYASLLGLFAVWDIGILKRVFPELNIAEVMFNSFMMQMNVNTASIALMVLSMVIEFLIGFFSTVVTAYLAITLSATVLQNKKFKGIVSFLIFVAIMVLVGYITTNIPVQLDYLTVQDMLIASLPTMSIHLALIVISFLLSAWLLDKKVSL